jgi:alpha-mannosidase
MSRFLTQKPCFNSINDFPHTTFNWYVNHGSNVAFGAYSWGCWAGLSAFEYACLPYIDTPVDMLTIHEDYY